MEHGLDLLSPVVPALETLQNEALRQILALNQQEDSLRNYSTNVIQLIQRYNAKKSYLGYAAHWYGEQTWWLKIVASIVFTGVAILLSIPTIISIVLSLVIPFLLINHNQVTQERDQLISHDLEAQNASVEHSVNLLNTTKTELQKTLQVLCTMNLEMTQDNIRLRDNLKKAECNLQEYQKNSVILEENIELLKAKEATLIAQLGTLSQEFAEYQSMIQTSASSFVKHEYEVGLTTTSLQQDSQNLSAITRRLQEGVTHLSSLSELPISAKGSPEALDKEGNLDTSLIEEARLANQRAQNLLAGYNSEAENSRVGALEQLLTPKKNSKHA